MSALASTTVSLFRSARQSAHARRLVACLLGLIVLAVMTGPSGSNTAPVSGFTGSLFHPRVLVFIAIGLGLWGLITAQHRWGEALKRTNDNLMTLPRRMMPDLHVNAFWQDVLVDQIGIYVLLAIGLNVVVGYAGLLDLGYIAFYAIGAYSTAFWTGALPVHPPMVLNAFWAIPFAIGTAMLSGVLIGAPTLRLRGDYLAIVTLGFGEIIQIVATNLQGVTGGSQGVIGIPHPDVNLLGIHYSWLIDPLPYYYLLLVFVVAALIAYSFLEHSRVGRAWTAIREDEVAAQSAGINVLKYKIMAFAIGASTSGFAGMLEASKISFIEPGDFTVQLSILILVLVIFGGMGSLLGAVVGAAFLQWFPWYLKEHPMFGFQDQDLYIYLGAILVLTMIFRPEGLIPSRRRKREFGLAEHGLGTADAMSGTTDPVP
jgi:branched-chain amino acid transport system permease protein